MFNFGRRDLPFPMSSAGASGSPPDLTSQAHPKVNANPTSTTMPQQTPNPYEGSQSWAKYSSSQMISSTPIRDTRDSQAMPAPSTAPIMTGTLMSPPEPTPYDSFSLTPKSGAKTTAYAEIHPRPNAPPLSPPVSPFTMASDALGRHDSVRPDNNDVILYPPHVDNLMSAPAVPLFAPTSSASIESVADPDRLVDEHIASRPASLFKGVEPPTSEEYKLALYFRSDIFSKFRENPRGWLAQEKELLRADRKHTSMTRPVQKLPAIDTIVRQPKPLMPSTRPNMLNPMAQPIIPNRVQKVKAPKMKIQTQATRPMRAPPTPARGTIQVSATPEPRTRAEPPNRNDKDFRALPDYAPPLHSLPDKPNSLKVEWKGNALDLSKDPDAHLLHADELHLAAQLRLDCAAYLTAKRRIFMRRLECAKKGKEFRKTDAQQACNIDVNKASKLWMAYEKVGWLALKWVQPFM